ncbi:MAG: cytochrome c biogenesis protein CcsA [Chloroflexi bacterium]|nr:cytochrome c biogenesis protein CcsA [Chloroflexota bacterium]
MAPLPPGVRLLGWAGLVLLLLALGGAFVIAPTEAVQGIHQRIFYIHVPLAWTAFLAVGVVLVASVGYLVRRAILWDVVAHSSADLGVVLTTLTLVTGAIWGRPIWGTWWSWDPKLTTTLILWFILVGYLMLRSYVPERERAARFCAALGILGAIDLPIIYFSTEWWRALHPPAVVVTSAGPAMPISMLWVFLLSFTAMNLLFSFLLLHRVRIERLTIAVLERLAMREAEAGDASR